MEARSADEYKILSVMRRRGMKLKTERSYLRHYRDFMRRSGLKAPEDITAGAVKSYLDYLAMERKVAVSTQRQALNALVFVIEKAFELKLGEIGDFIKSKKRVKTPVVMSKDETRRFFDNLEGEKLLMAKLQYATGLRVSELLRLRIQDIDLERNQVVVRSGKGYDMSLFRSSLKTLSICSGISRTPAHGLVLRKERGTKRAGIRGRTQGTG